MPAKNWKCLSIREEVYNKIVAMLEKKRRTYEEYSSIGEFVSKAVEEKLERLRAEEERNE
jgi:hypothetical protein